MSIEVTYKDLLAEAFIKEKLQQGIEVTASELTDYLEGLNTIDFTQPQFVAEDNHVTHLENASASKFKNTVSSLRQDLTVLYKEMLRLSDNAIRAYERWNVDAALIEKQLIDLEAHIDNLLLITQDTDGYYSTLLDNFTDAVYTDLDLSTCLIDLQANQVSLQPSGGVAERIFLNGIDPEKDVYFRVRSTANFIGRHDLQGADLVNIFYQGSKGWWTSILMNAAKPVTCELDVKLSSTPVPLSKICLELNDSAQSGAMQITPLYSTDNVNWSQLPTNTYTIEARTSCTFSFTEVQALWVKFILTKVGPDPTSQPGSFGYQFGFKSIAFYHEGFVPNTAQQFISKPRWVIGQDGQPVEFSKLVLNVCERIETNTKIRYYIMTSNDPTAPVDGNTVWLPIAPMTYLNSAIPTMLDVGALTDYTYGDTESALVDSEIMNASYQAIGAGDGYTNPAQSFHLLSYNELSEEVDDTAVSATGVRYFFKSSNDRILNYQLHSNLMIDDASFQLFRNIGKKGLDGTLQTSKVRDVIRGWGFEDPYYYCVIEILAPEGIEFDVGNSPMVIDGVSYTGKVLRTVLTGKTRETSGLHYIKVHKDNWYATPQGAQSAAELLVLEGNILKGRYNHKLLIEGYAYGANWPATEPKYYTGVDIFAQYLMKKIGVFDFLNNVTANQYNLFAADIDAAGTYAESDTPSTVFLFKVDEQNPDFQNERFMIRFKLVNQLRKYLRLRADLSTTDSTVTPALASYKIKLG